MQRQQRFAALDTDFLMALAIGDSDHESICDFIEGSLAFPLVVPTVLCEIQDLAELPGPYAQTAKLALRGIRAQWNILDPSLSSTQEAVAKSVTQHILNSGCLPDKINFKNDARFLAEAAVLHCAFVVSHRLQNLVGTSNLDQLSMVMMRQSVDPPAIYRQKELLFASRHSEANRNKWWTIANKQRPKK